MVATEKQLEAAARARQAKLKKKDEIPEHLLVDIQKAEAVQKALRKEGPSTKVGKAWEGQMDRTARRHVPEAFYSGPPTSATGQGRKGTVPPTMKASWSSKANHSNMLSNGWVPVVLEGEHVCIGVSLLYKRPIEFTIRNQKESMKSSNARVKAPDGNLEKLDRAVREAGAGGVTEDVTSIEKLEASTFEREASV